jgi:hypothetical protein
MTPSPIERNQQIAARVAGFLYLATTAIQMFAELYLRAPLLVPGNAAQTATNIATSEPLFRISTATILIGTAGRVWLLVALYVILEPVNRYAAFLAAFWRLVECAVFAMIALNDFVALSLLSGAAYLRSIDTKELQALARMFLSVRHSGGLIGGVFLGLGSALFAYVWLKSRYIPRMLAAWGIFSSLVLAAGILSIMVFPALTSVVGPAYWAPLFIFEVTLGFWLLVKGIRAPRVE